MSILILLSLDVEAWNTPGMVAPANNSTQWTGIGIDWNAVTGSSQYQVQLDTSMSFNSPALKQKIEHYINSSSSNQDTYEYFDDLYFGETYYWRVRAWVPNDTSAWSVVRVFNTRDEVWMDAPANNTTQWTGVGIDWLAHVGVDFYQVELDTSLTFASAAYRFKQEPYINSASANTDTYEFFDNLYFGLITLAVYLVFKK